MTAIFSQFKLKDVTLRNRIVVPPMCQYSAIDGLTNNWHLAHYSELARGGAGLVIVEATGVSPEGRITPRCTGIWHDDHIEGMQAIVQAIESAGAVPGIQIAHAGRKASANLPWEGDDHIPDYDPRGWEIIAPSAIAFGAKLQKIPRAMTLDDINQVKKDFVAAAKRALAAGFKWLELHFAHGYLAQSFFSIHANQRQDQYGGDYLGRGRFLLETLSAVRSVWPEDLPLTARFGVIEYDGRDEQTLKESIELIKLFKQQGLDMLSVSIGFSTPNANVPWADALLAPIAATVRKEANIPVAAAWGIDDPEIANQTIVNKQLDLVMIGRAHLANPHYPYQMALVLQKESPSKLLPVQYAHWLERYKGPGKVSAK